MDPAVKAAGELNAIFGRLEVPCEVCVTDAEGKHVKATTDLAEGVALVEEVPIVSWPSAHLVSLHLPFCFQCLRLSSHQLPAATADAAPTLPEAWSTCAQCSSSFCSSSCQQASARLHRLLCPSLATLQSDPAHPATDAKRVAASASGITLEALARCVAWIVQRLSSVVEQQKLTHDALQADYMLQQHQQGASCTATAASSSSPAWSTASLNYQLFTQVVTPFSRLISPPDDAEFDGISLPAWVSAVRTALADRCVKVLLVASGANLAAVKQQYQQAPLTFDAAASRSLLWAEALVQVVLSTDTLRTLVGQMVLNAHAINDFLLPAPTSAAPVTCSSDAHPASLGKFDWILKGAGLYALLACFNHSCAPNAAVSNVEGTHEIVLQTTRSVAAGAPLTITYIPVDAEASTPAARRQQLKNYFFTCRCPRCTEEEERLQSATAGSAATVATASA